MEGLSSPVWIRLPNLPLQYWDECNIARIASRFGTPLWIDAQTGSWGRREYARVCVRMNLATKLLDGVWINGWKGKFFQPMEYEGIGVMCYGCGRVGHRKEQCPSRQNSSESRYLNGSRGMQPPRNQAGKSPITPPPSRPSGVDLGTSSMYGTASASADGPAPPPSACRASAEDNEDEVGPWIQVLPRRRRNSRVPNNGGPSSTSKGKGIAPKQVDLSKVGVPQSKVRPTQVQKCMGFKKPLPFTAGIRRETPVVNRFSLDKELSLLESPVEIPQKRKKEEGGTVCGGDASPLVNQ
ncbi:uncharacterized protein LOC110108230 [Dendrobium catenatum]|uniref:uncharacterized protein LOC110108230 n=1 Tax=Dendrobium catenatum TaxID=906689 RepID=UPI0010A08297|nr:uncharacterized protein LOC110108230 [Dendrobium catenatum]